MKKHIREFFLRGLVAGGFGPLVLVVFYLILQQHIDLQTLTVSEVCTGVVSLYVVAFIAGGMNGIYQIERLPLMPASLIHGVVLYISYLAVYLINGWLQQGTKPILVFSGIFVLGYLAIWAIIYIVTRRNTAKLNQLLRQQQQGSQDS